MDFAGKKVVIAGEGISGRGAFAALRKLGAFPQFYSPENNVAPDLIVLSPGIAEHPLIEYAQTHGVPIYGEMELGWRIDSAPTIAVTGTNGKTTVTKLIGNIMRRVCEVIVCGNIGVSFAEAALTPHDLSVVEASSFQLAQTVEFAPHIAVILNITPDHMDRHKTFNSYVQAKLNVTRRQTERDYLVCPISLADKTEFSKAQKIFIGGDVSAKKGGIYYGEKRVLEIADIPLAGIHNVFNVMAAVAVAKLSGVPDAVIADEVKRFVPEPHRLQKIAVINGKEFYDDSKSTNEDSCLRACQAVNKRTALILGGSDKGCEFFEMFERLPASVSHIVITGENKDKLIAAAKAACRDYYVAEDLNAAVRYAYRSDAEAILLSPASASFDRYSNYAERGAAFAEIAEEIKNQSGD